MAPSNPSPTTEPHSLARRGSDSAPTEQLDVWSRTAPKYRIRAIILLIVNILLFAGVGSFAYWLRSGEHFAPAVPGYGDQLADTFRFTSDNGVTLGVLLLKPISVQDVPLQIVILGLLFAALISIPILVAILYRLGSALPFLAVVGFIAVLPWLAITLLVSCILASVRPFRTRFRFVSALVGLVPTVVYFILAWRGSAELIVGQVDPVDRIKFIAPWVLAVVAASAVFAIVLIIARLVDYRPGAITPLLAVMFGLPVALFEIHVGRDELYYRLLEDLNHAYFADVDTSVTWQEAAERAWQRHPLPRPRFEVIQQIEETKWLFELSSPLTPHESELTKHQAELAATCDAFLRSFPQSRYAANVLYLKARAWDTRVDLPEFRRTKWVRFHTDFPNAAARDIWQTLLANNPESILAGVAGLRLAQLDAREGNVERAIDRLTMIVQKFGETGAPGIAMSPATMESGAFDRKNPESSLRIPVDRILVDARRLRDLFTANRDPLYGYEPISGAGRRGDPFPYGLMDLDSRSERYAENLQRLSDKYPDAQIADNLELEIAKSQTALEPGIQRFQSLLEKHSKGDATPEALFRLALAYRAFNDPARSEETLARLIHEFRNSVWSDEAAGVFPRVANARLTRSAP